MRTTRQWKANARKKVARAVARGRDVLGQFVCLRLADVLGPDDPHWKLLRRVALDTKENRP